MEKSYLVHASGDQDDRVCAFSATKADAARIFSALYDADDCECFCITDEEDVTEALLSFTEIED